MIRPTMKSCAFPGIVLAALLVFVTACANALNEYEVDQAGNPATNRLFTEHTLANAAYRIEELGEFHLVDGQFHLQYGEGMTQAHRVTLGQTAFGDLDQDGLIDAAVILSRQSGGSGILKYLVAMRNAGNGFRQQDSLLLGDRIRVNTLSIVDGSVILDILTFNPDDPVCCPTRPLKMQWVLRNGKWRTMK